MLFSENLTQAHPHKANNLEWYTFIMPFSGKSDTLALALGNAPMARNYQAGEHWLAALLLSLSFAHV